MQCVPNLLIISNKNKRIVVFDSNGQFLTQFGEPGFDIGQLDEPVGVSLGMNGEVYVAYLTNLSIDNNVVDAVGIFKSDFATE